MRDNRRIFHTTLSTFPLAILRKCPSNAAFQSFPCAFRFPRGNNTLRVGIHGFDVSPERGYLVVLTIDEPTCGVRDGRGQKFNSFSVGTLRVAKTINGASVVLLVRAHTYC